jgi:hypothetical protein
MDKAIIQEQQQKILALIEEFCTLKLDSEYSELSKKLIQKLGRKREVPFIKGQPKVWASAIIHALGSINFLFDKTFSPYVSLDEINDFFGTGKTTTGTKSKQIRDMLKLNCYDKEFSTKTMQENNPFNKFVMVDGFFVSLHTLPEHVQQAVKQARAEGKDISLTSQYE